MLRAVPLVVLFLPLIAQSSDPPPAAPPSHPDPALVEVQSLLDNGKLSDAEQSARRYLDAHGTSADAHYLLGYVLFREANPKASLAEYTEGARHRPPRALDLEVIGSDYFLLEDYPEAGKWFTKAVELDPSDALARFYLGRAKFNEKHFDEAIHAFTQCLKLQPANGKAADNLGMAYEALGKNEDALAAYRTAIAADTGAALKNAGPYLNLGTLLVESGRSADAIVPLLEAVQFAPADPRAHRELGKAYLQLNRLEESRRELEKAAALAPENAPVHFLLAQAFRKQGLADQAQIETERYTALTGAHSSPDTPLQEMRALIELGKLRDAENIARQYVEIHKNSGEGHYLLGYILFKEEDPKASLAEYTEGAKYRKPSAADLEAVAGDYVLLKDYVDADKWFTKALEWNPSDALGWYYLGRTKYNENRFDEAVSAFQNCLKLDPRNVKAQDNLGLSLEGLNRMEEAAAAYRTAIEWQSQSSAKNAGPYLDLGSLLVDNDRAPEALPHLVEAAQLAPQDYRVHRQLGKTYARLNELEKARAEFEHAAQLAPRDAPIHFMLAQVYRRQGLLDKATGETELYTKLTESNAEQSEPPAAGRASTTSTGRFLQAELRTGITAKTAKAGDPVKAIAFTSATLSNGIKINRGAEIFGQVRAADSTSIAISFDEVEVAGKKTQLSLSIRGAMQPGGDPSKPAEDTPAHAGSVIGMPGVTLQVDDSPQHASKFESSGKKLQLKPGLQLMLGLQE